MRALRSILPFSLAEVAERRRTARKASGEARREQHWR
jgi:hypothetical protein